MVIATPPATAPPAAAPETRIVSLVGEAPHGWATHRVKSGETLVAIATRYRTTPGVIAARNHITNPRQLRAGSTISVPRTGAQARSTDRTTRPLGGYTVRPGDTLYDIAAQHRMSVAALAKANRLSPSAFIHPGQRLVVRGGSGSAAPAKGSGATYTVRSGDTLSGIASRQGITVAALAKANSLRAGTFIHPGRLLRLPGRVTATGKHVQAPVSATYPAAVQRNAERNRAVLAGRSVPGRAATRDLVVATARRHGVDPALALAIAMRESSWNQRAVSPANAVGVMQVIPAGGEWASSLYGRRLDLLDTQDNITAGVVMLKALQRSARSEDEAIAAYYQGLASVRSRGMYADTKQYVAGVKRLKARM